MTQGSFYKFCLYGFLFGLFDFSKEQYDECCNKDSQCYVHCGSCVNNCRVFRYLTNQSSEDNVNSHSCCAVESTAYLNQLVSSVAAAAKDIEQRIYYGVEHTHAETGDKCAEKINPHAFKSSGEEFQHHTDNSYDERKECCLFVTEFHDEHT